MGNSINKIQEGLYICGVAALSPAARLKQLGIHCVLNAAEVELYRTSWREDTNGEPSLEKQLEDFDVKIIGAQDHEACNLSYHFADIADFIEAGIAKGGVVVHCAAGISRASTSCCAYLMIKEHWTLKAAFTRIHGVRSFVQPNAGFWRQLRDLEASLIHQGITLNELPDDYKFPDQPEEREEERETEDTASRIEGLDLSASSQESFVTIFLTGVVVPRAGVPAAELAQAILLQKIQGTKFSTLAPDDKGNIIFRAGLVPSLNAGIFQKVLSATPGVETVTVEGLDSSP